MKRVVVWIPRPNNSFKVRAEKLEEYLVKRKKHASKRIEIIEEDHLAKGDSKNFHAGKEIGYWTGLKTGYVNALDIVERELKMKW